MCAAENAALATIVDGYDEAYVETIMLNQGFRSTWIGLQQDKVNNWEGSFFSTKIMVVHVCFFPFFFRLYFVFF